MLYSRESFFQAVRSPGDKGVAHMEALEPSFELWPASIYPTGLVFIESPGICRPSEGRGRSLWSLSFMTYIAKKCFGVGNRLFRQSIESSRGLCSMFRVKLYADRAGRAGIDFVAVNPCRNTMMDMHPMVALHLSPTLCGLSWRWKSDSKGTSLHGHRPTRFLQSGKPQGRLNLSH